MFARTTMTLPTIALAASLAACVPDGYDDDLARLGTAAETVKGVEFSPEEAGAVIWGVNQATFEELDGPVGLDRRAAANLVEATPLNSVSAMGEIAYVGPAALTKLRDYAPVWEQQALHGSASQAGFYKDVFFDDATAEVALALAQSAPLSELREGARLPSRGANAILANRPYATLAEVAAVEGVGTVTMSQLRYYAASLVMPGPEVVKDVAFTAEEVAIVLWGVNQATVHELDKEVPIDRRAAEGLVAGAPFTSIAQMGQVPYVSTVALLRLRRYADAWTAKKANLPQLQAGIYNDVVFDEPTAQMALLLAQTATLEELIAAGLPSQPASAMVNGRSYESLGQVAAVYGVGTVTMSRLHDFAVEVLATGN